MNEQPIDRVARLVGEACLEELEAICREDGYGVPDAVRAYVLRVVDRILRDGVARGPSRVDRIAELSDAQIKAEALRWIDLRAALAPARPS